jgi:predicted MFS family arabinose efflux permease
MVFNILPLLLGSVQDGLGFTDKQLGFLTSAYFFGFTLSTISAFYWVRKCHWQKSATLLSALTLAACLLLLVAQNFVMYLFLIGLLGATTSAVYAIGTTYLGDTENPARSYGFKIGAEAALGAILLLMLPPLVVSAYGLQGLLVSMLGVFLLLSLSIFWLPSRGIKGSEEFKNSLDTPDQLIVPIILSLSALFIFFAGISALWAFIERIGNDAGFAATDIGTALSISLVFAMSGSFLAGGLGDRFGFLQPVVAAFLVLVLGLFTLQLEGFIVYFIGVCLFALAYGFALPVQVTIVSCFDSNGEFVVLTAVSIALGGIVGPAVAGFLKSPDSNIAILLFTGVTVAISVAIYAYVFQFARYKEIQDQQNRQPSETPF